MPPTESSRGSNRRSAGSPWAAGLLGVTPLALATLDLSLDHLPGVSALPLESLLPAFGATIAATFCGLVAAAGLVRILVTARSSDPEAKEPGWPRALAAASLGMAAGFLLARVTDSLEVPDDPVGWLRAALIATAAAATGCLAFRMCAPAGGLLVRRVTWALAGAQLLGLVWLEAEPQHAGWVAATLLATAAAITLLLERRRPRWAPGALLLGSALAVPGALLATIPGGPRDAGELPQEGTKLPDVILVTIDSLRADAVGWHQARPPAGTVTPRLDALAASSTVFERSYAPAPWTLPSLVSLFTGRSPLVHGTLDGRFSLPEELPLLPKILGSRGYRTVCVGGNPNIVHQARLLGAFDRCSFYPQRRSSSFGQHLLERLRPSWSAADRTTRELTDLALAELELARRIDRPLFLWLHYFDPHSPYEPPSEHPPAEPRPPTFDPSDQRVWMALRTGARLFDAAERRYLRSAYEAEVRYVDEQANRLVQALDPANTLLVLASDHGEEFWEHGRSFHGQSLFEELLRVPLLIRRPGQSTQRRIDEPVSLQDLGVTILSELGIDADEAGLPGRSLLGKTPLSRPLVATGVNLFEDQVALIQARRKLIRGLSGGREMLFDLDRDPEERRPLSLEDPAYGELRPILDAILSEARSNRHRLGIAAGAEPVSLDPESRERLRALGYLNE